MNVERMCLRSFLSGLVLVLIILGHVSFPFFLFFSFFLFIRSGIYCSFLLWWAGSLTCVHIDIFDTFFAFHLTAPMEFALTFACLFYCFRIVTSTAAHDITTICPERCLVTTATSRTQGSNFQVPQTVIRWSLEINEVGSRWPFVVLVGHD